jgi:HAD superfamily hydrolase (TIGR01484 family)
MYKGLIFDIDGTAVPLAAMVASTRLQETIKKARPGVKITAASGRSLEMALPILKSMGLKQPCVISGGSTILDPQTGKVLWSKHINKPETALVLEMLKRYESKSFIVTDPAKEAEVLKDQKPEVAYVIYALGMKLDEAQALTDEIAAIDDLIAHQTPSWDEDRMDVHITHQEATKEHAIHVLKEMLGLTSEQLIGVGDSGNDIPIFRAVSHKVAMGNATDALKELADEIAPTVDENGLATIIEKYFD